MVDSRAVNLSRYSFELHFRLTISDPIACLAFYSRGADLPEHTNQNLQSCAQLVISTIFCRQRAMHESIDRSCHLSHLSTSYTPSASQILKPTDASRTTLEHSSQRFDSCIWIAQL